MNSLFIHLQTENMPTMIFEFVRDRIVVGASALVRLTVTAQPGAIYRDMRVTLSMPTAMMSVCQVSVKVGSGLPCVDADEIMESVQLSSVR